MSRVQAYYDTHSQLEWERQDRHPTEFAVTARALADYLPEPPAAVLDVGCGPGRYSIALASRGYAVTQLDLSAGVLELARQKAREHGVALAGSVQGSATDLGRFADESFDAVLLMGPLYHLLELSEREQALREARRVLRPSGPIFASFITRYAAIHDAAKRCPEIILAQREQWEEMLATGVLADPLGDGGFTDAYVARPDEVRPLMERAGFATLDLIAVEGIVGWIEERIKQLDGEAWSAWVDLNYRLGRDPSIHGAAAHLLYVGRKGD